MDKRAKRLAPVRALRDRQLQEEARKMANAAGVYQAALKQLQELEQYLRDYYADPSRGTITFGSAQDLIRYQQFVVKLNEAIQRQRQFASLKEMGHKAAQRRWLEAKARVEAIDTLIARAEAEAQRRESKREQRQSDEHAARLVRTRADADSQLE